MNHILVISRQWLTPTGEWIDENKIEVGKFGVTKIIKIDDFKCFQVEYESGEVVWVTDVNYIRWGELEKSELETEEICVEKPEFLRGK